MIKRLLWLTCLLAPSLAMGQTNGWIKVEAGTALYLDPYQATWGPVSDGQQVLLHSYLLTQAEARAFLFKETKAVELPPSAYFYLEDVIPKTRVEVVAALTRIEVSQLPVNTNEPGERVPRAIGLTYGHPVKEAQTMEAVPYEKQRYQAIQWFYERGRLDAALLALKRTMTKFPQLYAEEAYVEQLFHLYSQLALYGFLMDESKRLLKAGVSEQFDVMVHHWHGVAKDRLIQQ